MVTAVNNSPLTSRWVPLAVAVLQLWAILMVTVLGTTAFPSVLRCLMTVLATLVVPVLGPPVTVTAIVGVRLVGLLWLVGM